MSLPPGPRDPCISCIFALPCHSVAASALFFTPFAMKFSIIPRPQLPHPESHEGAGDDDCQPPWICGFLWSRLFKATLWNTFGRREGREGERERERDHIWYEYLIINYQYVKPEDPKISELTFRPKLQTTGALSQAAKEISLTCFHQFDPGQVGQKEKLPKDLLKLWKWLENLGSAWYK